jgi:hypothetical protein
VSSEGSAVPCFLSLAQEPKPEGARTVTTLSDEGTFLRHPQTQMQLVRLLDTVQDIECAGIIQVLSYISMMLGQKKGWNSCGKTKLEVSDDAYDCISSYHWIAALEITQILPERLHFPRPVLRAFCRTSTTRCHMCITGNRCMTR